MKESTGTGNQIQPSQFGRKPSVTLTNYRKDIIDYQLEQTVTQ
ncbi:hypothetical protein ACEQPO_11310 [Bacillus sp. SL00103]